MTIMRRSTFPIMATAVIGMALHAGAESTTPPTIVEREAVIDSQSQFRPVIPIDLGTITPSTPYLIKLTLVNESDRSYDFREIQKSCNCSDPHFESGPLEVGESRELSIKFESNNNRAIKGQGRFSLTLREADKSRAIPLSLDFRYSVHAFVGFNERQHPVSVAKDDISLVAKIPITVCPQVDLNDLTFEIGFPTAQHKIERVSPGSWDALLTVEVALEALSQRSTFEVRCHHPQTDQGSTVNVIFRQEGGIKLAPGILLFRQADRGLEATAMLVRSGAKARPPIAAETTATTGTKKPSGPPHVEITISGIPVDASVQNSATSTAKLLIKISDQGLSRLETKLSETQENPVATCRIWWHSEFLETEVPLLLP